MDAETILGLRPALREYLRTFDDCMGRQSNCRHRDRYVEGQLSGLERKSVEPIADLAGVHPRTLQEFLSMLIWDEPAMRDRLQQRVASQHAHPDSVGVIDETSYVKKGVKTAGVQRQHCGAVGKKENCVVSVHLGYVAGDFHTLLDGEPYLPEKTWHDDRDRCRAAGVPDDVVFRTKPQIALGQVQRALNNGVRFRFLTFDELYGCNLPFLRGLEGLGQTYVAEIPVSFWGWSRRPDVAYQAHPRDGLPANEKRRKPRLKARQAAVGQVRNLLKYSPRWRKVAWEHFRVKEGAKGPMVYEAKRLPFWVRGEDGMPCGPYHLIAVRPVLAPNEVKFFLSNAPQSTSLEVLLLVAFSRWHIERMFEDSKGEIGLDHFEVRRYRSICRHLILSCVSLLFLSEQCQAHRKKKSGVDGVPGANGAADPGAHLEPGRALQSIGGRSHRRRPAPHADPQRPSPHRTPQGHAA